MHNGIYVWGSPLFSLSGLSWYSSLTTVFRNFWCSPTIGYAPILYGSDALSLLPKTRKQQNGICKEEPECSLPAAHQADPWVAFPSHGIPYMHALFRDVKPRWRVRLSYSSTEHKCKALTGLWAALFLASERYFALKSIYLFFQKINLNFGNRRHCANWTSSHRWEFGMWQPPPGPFPCSHSTQCCWGSRSLW